MPPACAPSGRDTATDLLRGWAIMGVVAIHACGLVLPAAAYYSVGYYFRWAVPVFICAYAFYGARPLAPGQYAAVVGQRYARVLLPFAAYSLLYAVVLGDVFRSDTLATLWRYLRGDGWAGQYFFLVLFQVIPLLPLIARWRVSLGAVLAGLALHAALLIALPAIWQHWSGLQAWSDRLVLYWLPYVLLGVYLRQNQAAWRERMARVPQAAAAALLALAPVWLSLTYDPAWPTGPYLLPAVGIVSAVLYVLHERALQPLAARRWAWAVAYLGRYSLVVFCLNPLFVHALQRTLAPGLFDGLALPAAAALALALVLLICAGASALGAALRRGPLRALAA